MVYILRHHPEGTYLTDIARETGVSKSTLSALIKKLREKGYLYFQENPCDVRKKTVLPTEKLKSEGRAFLKKAEEMEEEICSVLSVRKRHSSGSWSRSCWLICPGWSMRNKKRQEVYLP